MDSKNQYPNPPPPSQQQQQHQYQTMDTKEPNYNMPPPAYTEKAPEEICISRDWLADQPVTLKMKGHHDNPDFEIVAPNGTRILEVTSDVCSWYHEMTIINAADGSKYFTMKRKLIDNGDIWRFAAHRPGKDGQKILEFDCREKIDAKNPPRLIFRNPTIDELDAVKMVPVDGGQGGDGEYIVTYHGKRVGRISMKTSRVRETPEAVLELEVPGVDPILFVALVLFRDCRTLSPRRRQRRGVRDDLWGVAQGKGTPTLWYMPLLML